MQSVYKEKMKNRDIPLYSRGMPPLVLYDGVCGLCNRAVRAILRRDRAGRFRFASLQGDTGRRVLERHGLLKSRPDSIVLLADEGQAGERMLLRSAAVMFIAGEIGGRWSIFRLFRWLPGSFRDGIYDWVARNRYRWFGRLESCPSPENRYRERFLD